MRHLGLHDRVLLCSVMGFWALCFALHLGLQLQGALAWLPVTVEAGARGPTVDSFWSEREARESGLRLGDTIVAVGDRELDAETGPFGFALAVYAQRARPVPVTLLRGATSEAVPLELVPISSGWVATLVSLWFAGIGALVFVRARGARPARFAFLALAAYSLHWTYFFGAGAAQTALAIAVFGGSLSLAFPLAIRAVTVFPVEVAREDALRRWFPWLLAASGLGVCSWGFGVPFPAWVGQLVTPVASVACLGWAAAEIGWSFRQAGPDGRRQLKWVLLGFYLALAPITVAGIAAGIEPALWQYYELSVASAIAIPICVLIAITRDRLFDIDGAITRAASYTLVVLLFLSAAFLLAPRAAQATAGWVEPEIAEPAFAVAMAGIVLWGRQLLEPRLERWFFREREELEHGARALRDALSECEKPEELLALLGNRLDALIEPSGIAIYAAADDAFAALFARGPLIAPAFSGGSRLVGALELADGCVPAERLERALRGGGGDPESLAALQTMGVELVVPLHSEGGLEAFVCLGDKRSGDLYRDTDLAQLESIAERCREAFAAFDRSALEAVHQEQIRSLERYVPTAVAEPVLRGERTEQGEADVTVMFADIRGYTTLSEARTPDGIFDLVSAYTKRVSEIVNDHGGAVVDFSGDGLMAVFGAPRPLDGKEAHALDAAREILSSMAEIERAPGEDHGPVEVGIGVATGPGHVGTIDSVDRSIWCVLGNTTNLAARLQSMTRTLGEAALVDEETRQRAGAADLRGLGPMPVRGRSEPIDMHAIPWSQAAA